jgi:hypothetical protein
MSAVSVYKEKIKLKGYQKSLETEIKVATGELQVLPRSLTWERELQPFRQMLRSAAGTLPSDVVGRGFVIGKLMEAKKYTTGMFQNIALAKVHALQAVEALVDLGVPRDRAVSIVADIVGLSKSLLTGGAPARGGGGGGAPSA